MGNKSTKDNKYVNTFTQPQHTLEQIRKPALEEIENCLQAAHTYMKTANEIKTLINTSDLVDTQKERICVHHIGTINLDENVTSCQGMTSDKNMFKLAASEQHTLIFLKRRLIDTCEEDKLMEYIKLPEYINFTTKFAKSLLEKVESTRTIISLMRSYNNITMNHILTQTHAQTLEESYAIINYDKGDDHRGDSHLVPITFRIEPVKELAKLYIDIEKVFYGCYQDYRVVPLKNMLQVDLNIAYHHLKDTLDLETDT